MLLPPPLMAHKVCKRACVESYLCLRAAAWAALFSSCPSPGHCRALCPQHVACLPRTPGTLGVFPGPCVLIVPRKGWHQLGLRLDVVSWGCVGAGAGLGGGQWTGASMRKVQLMAWGVRRSPCS